MVFNPYDRIRTIYFNGESPMRHLSLAILVALALACVVPASAKPVRVEFDNDGRLTAIHWGDIEVVDAEDPEPVIRYLGDNFEGRWDENAGTLHYKASRASAKIKVQPGDDRLRLVLEITNTTDAVIEDTSKRRDQKIGEIFALSLAGWQFEKGPAFIDPRYSGWIKNDELKDARGFDRRISYPGWGYAPVTACWDNRYTVGVSCHEPTIPYLYIRAWEHGNDPFRIQFDLRDPIEPGETLTREFILTFADSGDWQTTLTPYKEFLHKTWPAVKLRNPGPFHHTYTRREHFNKETKFYKPGTTYDMVMMHGAKQAAAIGCTVAIFKGLFPHSGAWGIRDGKGHEFNPNYEQLANIDGGAMALREVNRRIKEMGLIPAAMTRVGVGIDEKGNLVKRDFSDPEQVEDQFRRIRTLIGYGFEGAYADQLAGFKENYRTIPPFLKKFQQELGDQFFMLAEHDWDVLSQYTQIIVNAPAWQTDARLAQFMTPDTPRYLSAKFANADWREAQRRRRYATTIGCIPWWLGPHYTPRVNEHTEGTICAEWWRANWDKVDVRPNDEYIRQYLPEYWDAEEKEVRDEPKEAVIDEQLGF
jgi:hypothetical protein